MFLAWHWLPGLHLTPLKIALHVFIYCVFVACVYVSICEHTCVGSCGSPRLILGDCPLPYSWRPGLSQLTSGFMDTANVACLIALGILTPHHPDIAITGRLLHLLSIYVGPGGPHLGSSCLDSKRRIHWVISPNPGCYFLISTYWKTPTSGQHNKGQRSAE